MSNPFEILNLKPGDTLDTAKKNRNALFLKLHPDKNPSDKNKYQKVYDAYETLRNNPELFNPVRVTSTHIEQTIRVRLNVTIEDFYLKRTKTIQVNRKVFCKICDGTGSASKENGICPHCRGTGRIESNVLALLGKGSTCPICHGSGLKACDICPTCGGTRYLQEARSVSFVLETINFHKKIAVLHNIGNQLTASTYGSVAVILNILHDNSVTIEEDYFVIYDRVFPIQKIIGDKKTINIFGREVPYEIEENSTEAYTRDQIAPGITQLIRIKFLEIIPMLTRETISLYKEILEIEKESDTDGCTIRF